MSTFSEEQRNELRQRIENGVSEAARISKENQKWDIFFKIVALAISIAIVACSGLATSDFVATTKGLTLASTLLAGVSSALSSFAFNQFNFSKRQRDYDVKMYALQELRDELEYLDPPKEEFLDQLKEVESWTHADPPPHKPGRKRLPDGPTGPKTPARGK